MEEIQKQIAELKIILKFYHGEPKRKVMIDEIIKNIETIINK